MIKSLAMAYGDSIGGGVMRKETIDKLVETARDYDELIHDPVVKAYLALKEAGVLTVTIGRPSVSASESQSERF